MKLKIRILLLFMLFCLIGIGNNVYAQESGETGFQVTENGLKQDENGNFYCQSYYSSWGRKKSIRFQIAGPELRALDSVTFESSDPSVCSVDPADAVETRFPHSYDTPYSVYAGIIFVQPGTATITARIRDKEYKATVIIAPTECADISRIEVNDYQSIRISWNKIKAATGYVILRIRDSKDSMMNQKIEEAAVIDNADTLSAVIDAPRDIRCEYAVYPKMKVGQTEYFRFPEDYVDSHTRETKWAKYTLQYSHKKSLGMSISGNRFTLRWTTDPYVQAYEIYEKKIAEGDWSLIHTATSKETGTFTKVEEPGKGYIFRVVYVYPNLRLESNWKRCYQVKSTAIVKRATKIKQTKKDGQYEYSQGILLLESKYSSPDETYYYEKQGKLHVVSRLGKKLVDYTTDGKGKVTARKTISLGRFTAYGGCYYAPDGNYYVAVAFNNGKKSKTKTVIKVMKYSSVWAKIGECNITGDAENKFPGIVIPIRSGNCRMEYCEDALYLFTCRQMFNGHQSNISFRINTASMSYVMANEDYTSHSFNQFVRYDDHTLYLSNHGDGYDRGVNLTTVSEYGTDKQEIQTFLPFSIMGKTGDNYTGLTEGGMETTSGHVLIAGTSVPQRYPVAGVTGASKKYAHNVYIITAEKGSEKSSVHWLTQYNPKKSKVKVGQVRLVKLSDDYVVLLYTTTKKAGKETTTVLNYVVLNESGSVVYKTTYKGMCFTAGTQPILYNGSIVWTDVVSTYNKKTGREKDKTYYYSIPARIG